MNTKFGVFVHLGMAECHIPFSGHCDLVLRSIFSLEYISYIICDRNPKFGVWKHLGMVECRVPFMGYCDLDL